MMERLIRPKHPGSGFTTLPVPKDNFISKKKRKETKRVGKRGIQTAKKGNCCGSLTLLEFLPRLSRV